MGSAPGLTVFDSVSRSRMTQTALDSFLYSFKWKNGTCLEVFPKLDTVLGFVRASCEFRFPFIFMYKFYVHESTVVRCKLFVILETKVVSCVIEQSRCPLYKSMQEEFNHFSAARSDFESNGVTAFGRDAQFTSSVTLKLPLWITFFSINTKTTKIRKSDQFVIFVRNFINIKWRFLKI